MEFNPEQGNALQGGPGPGKSQPKPQVRTPWAVLRIGRVDRVVSHASESEASGDRHFPTPSAPAVHAQNIADYLSRDS